MVKKKALKGQTQKGMKNNQSKCEYKYYIRKILNKVTKCKNKKILLRKLNLSKKSPHTWAKLTNHKVIGGRDILLV